MITIDDVAGLYNTIERVHKSKGSDYTAGWIHAIHDEVKGNAKKLWTKHVQEAVLKILAPFARLNEHPTKDERICQTLRQLEILECTEATGLISDVASIVFAYT